MTTHSDTPGMARIIRAAATAIANTRLGRHGTPPVENVLELLPVKLRAEVEEDARAALRAAAYEELRQAVKTAHAEAAIRRAAGN